jgi:hypothetical protein
VCTKLLALYSKDSGSMSKTIDCLIVQHVVVNSAARDVSAYACPNHYSVRLPDSIKSCVRVRLLSATIPRTEPPIKETAWLDFDEGGQIYSICVKPGFYTIDELITSVGSLFSTSSSPWSNSYSVAFDRVAGRVSITATNPGAQPFSILFGTGPHASSSLAKSLGFQHDDTVPSTGTTGTCFPDMNGSPFVDLVVDEAPIRSCKTVLARDGSSRRILARIPMTEVPMGQVKYHREKDCPDNLADPSPVGRLTIRLIDDMGRPYDTQMLEISIVLELVSVGKRFALPSEKELDSKPPTRQIAFALPSPERAFASESPPAALKASNNAAKYLTYAFYALSAGSAIYLGHKVISKASEEE